MVVHLLHTEQGVSSNLTFTTILYLPSVMAAYQSPKLLVGVRVPGGMPNKGREIISRRSALEHLPSTNFFASLAQW